MPDFWRDSGFHLLNRKADGRLLVTDDFLRAYFLRPEIRPIDESCDAERALHDDLLNDPRAAIPAQRLMTLVDPDARDNYQVVLGFRDRLIEAETLEDCYLATFLQAEPRENKAPIPPLFIDQMAHIILRAILDGNEDGLRARSAEMLFRAQKVTITDGAIMAADAETVDMHATSGGFGSLGELVVQAQTPLRTVELDILDDTNAALYWGRDQAYDTVINLNFAGPGLDALCRVLEAWVKHFLSIEVQIQPVQKITDEKWVWHLGLDAEASSLLDDLYNGADVGEGRLARMLSLFRLDFADPSVMPAKIAGRPVYMAMAVTTENTLRLKPQNLLVNLPLAEKA